MSRRRQEKEAVYEAWLKLIDGLTVLTKENVFRWHDSHKRCDLILLQDLHRDLRVWNPTEPESGRKRREEWMERTGPQVVQLWKCVSEQKHSLIWARGTPIPSSQIDKTAYYYIKNRTTGEYLALLQKPWSWTGERHRAVVAELQTAAGIVEELAKPDPLSESPRDPIDAIVLLE